MSCANCERVRVNIKLPSELKSAINIANQRIVEGTFTYIGYGQYADPFSRISGGNNWSDFVDVYFSCNSCQQKFRLYAETYHGSGGKFCAVQNTQSGFIKDVFERT